VATRGRPRAFDREQALRLAMRAFWDRGYEATSINFLASRMGINPPSLYAAFGDKQSLFRSAVELYGENEGSIARRALAGTGTARAAVETMLRESVDRFTDPAMPGGCMVVLSAINCTEANDPVQTYVADLRRRDERALRDRFAQAIADGELRAGADPARLAAYYHSVLYGLSIQARDGAGRERLHGVVDLALESWPG
jgi:AcrR family transcriptional regulator